MAQFKLGDIVETQRSSCISVWASQRVIGDYDGHSHVKGPLLGMILDLASAVGASTSNILMLRLLTGMGPIWIGSYWINVDVTL